MMILNPLTLHHINLTNILLTINKQQISLFEAKKTKKNIVNS